MKGIEDVALYRIGRNVVEHIGAGLCRGVERVEYVWHFSERISV
jgi:hypothetical protein